MCLSSVLFISISELYKNDIPYIIFWDLLFKNSSVTFPRSRGSCGFGLSVLKNIPPCERATVFLIPKVVVSGFVVF